MCLGKREGKSFLKKNLAKERMQRIRKSLSDEKIKEICHVDLVTKKTSQKFRSLPSSSSKHIKFCIVHFSTFYTFSKVLRYLFRL